MKAQSLAFLTVGLAAGLASAVALSVSSAGAEPETVSQGSIATHTQEEVSEGPSPGYSRVVDNADEGRFDALGWEVSSGGEHYAGDYASLGPPGEASPARFEVDVPESGQYTVYARWPAAEGNAAAARFGVSTASGTEWTEVDQRVDGGMWVRLGAYDLEAGESNAVQVAPGSEGDGTVVADAVVVLSGQQANPDEAAGEEPTGGTTLRARGQSTGRDVVRRARKHIGTRYRESPPHPCKAYRKEDCSCHTKTVFRTFGRKLPDNPPSQYKFGRSIKRSNLRPGDLVFFDENRNGELQPWDHVGIYSGNGHLVHASSYYGKVVERKMKYIKGYWGAKRLNLD
jgi:cell wall-associated NlpC family hydrolase